MHQLLSAADFLLSQQEHLLSFARRPVAAKQDSSPTTDVSFDGVVTIVAFAVMHLSRQSKVYTSATLHAHTSQLSALQTLIWPSQAESEGITKIN